MGMCDLGQMAQHVAAVQVVGASVLVIISAI